MERRRTHLQRLWLLVALTLCVPAVAAAAGVPASLRGAILAKALGYEKTLPQKSSTLRIAVVGPDSRDADRMLDVLSKLARSKVAGRSAQVVRIDASTSTEITEAVRSRGVEVAYIPDGAGRSGHSIAQSLVDAGRLVLCGDADDVGRGCVLSVEPAGSSSRLVVDVLRAKRAGFEFDPRMLRLARVVR